MEKRFIEGARFPVELVNQKSQKEKQSGGRPPFWEMVFWWTRKPLSGARAVIGASLLPEEITPEEFTTQLRLNEVIPHKYPPLIFTNHEFLKYFQGKKMLDPFAGFGCIPFEALRLGLEVTASELLPTAYIFLKAILEYPAEFGNTLVKDVERWGEWITEKLKEDEEIKELYEEGVAVYIGTWEIKCPHCGKWTPIVGNWWLARVKDSRGKYKKLAYMTYQKTEEGIEIEVIDVNKEVGATENAKVDTNKGEIVIDGEIYKVPAPNINSRREQMICLSCGSVIRFVDAEGNHYTDKNEVAREKREELEFYVKWALKKYHSGDERFARQRLLVKVKIEDGDLIFERATLEDNKKLENAKEKVKKLIESGDIDVPTEEIPIYENRSIWVIGYGFKKWCHLFNPRQLLTLIKITKLIREAGKRVEEEKLKEGWDEEKAFKYSEAIATYLSIALCKYADYNFLCNFWDVNIPKISHGLTMRGIAMMWNWADECPYQRFVGSWVKVLDYSIPNSLKYLTSVLSNKTKIPKIIQADTTSLNLGERFDIIVTDPPYADDVPYTELSDFYYVWLKRALSDVEGGKLIPRYHREAFFKKIGKKYIEIKTQWQELAKKEVSENAGRFMDLENKKEIAKKHFENLLTQSFIAMKNHLKEDGLLVTYYAHTSPEAWASLLYAGWKGAKVTITNAFPLTTESAQSIVSRGKLALDTSIVVVWRKIQQEEEKNINTLREEIIEAVKERAKELINQGYVGRDVLIGAMARALNIITRYKELYDSKGNLTVEKLLTEYVYPFTAMGIAESLREIAETGEIKKPESLFYLLVKALFGSKEKMTAKKMEKSDIILLRLSTKVDTDKLVSHKILKRVKEEYRLLEPTTADASKFEKFLKEEREINFARLKVRDPLDGLHLMEYYSLILPTSKLRKKWEELREEFSSELEEAFTLGKILAKILPNADPEKELAKSFVGKVEGREVKPLQQEKIF